MTTEGNVSRPLLAEGSAVLPGGGCLAERITEYRKRRGGLCLDWRASTKSLFPLACEFQETPLQEHAYLATFRRVFIITINKLKTTNPSVSRSVPLLPT